MSMLNTFRLSLLLVGLAAASSAFADSYVVYQSTTRYDRGYADQIVRADVIGATLVLTMKASPEVRIPFMSPLAAKSGRDQIVKLGYSIDISGCARNDQLIDEDLTRASGCTERTYTLKFECTKFATVPVLGWVHYLYYVDVVSDYTLVDMHTTTLTKTYSGPCLPLD